jgi:putative ABC transport system permease protein
MINIAGLAIGMAACFFIFQYVRFELSYDRFHKNADRLYRVPYIYSGSFSNESINAVNHPAVGPAMKADFPEVVEFARVAPPSVFLKTATFTYTDEKGNTKKFNEERFFLTDASFLTMFSFPFVTGNPATSLVKPNSLVLSETTDKKYFGNTNPLNKTLLFNGGPFTVTGVCKDVPENSHIKFDLLISLNKFGYNEWGWPEFYNYVLLAPGTDPKKVEAKFPAFIQKYLGQRLKELKFGAKFYLQPVTDIHLKSDFRREVEVNGSEKIIYFLSILGVFILVIAWINYINLSTAKSLERAREVGLRKVVGASRLQLSLQFIFESFIINCIALFIAFIIVISTAGWFDQFTGKHIIAAFRSSGQWQTGRFWFILLGVFVAGALQVGAYPAFILSAFKPALVLKGKFDRSNRGILLRKALVSFQFILSIILIAGTIIVYRQLQFMRNRDLGYNKDQIVVVKAPAVYDSTFQSRANAFKTELLKNPAIKHMAPSTEIPGKTIFARNSVRRANEDKTHNFIAGLLEIDKDFVPTYQMKLAAGNNLPDQEAGNVFETRNTKVLINEELVKALEFKSNEEALHQKILFVSWFGDIACEVVGIVKNYHQRSLREPYAPILYYHNNRSDWSYFSINMQTKDLHKNLAYIENLYHKIFPGNAFESFFLDEYFNQQYKADQQFGKIFGLFTIFAIIIACLGLTGLSTFAIKVRTKEIGIRKVLGASVPGIVYLFFKDFIKLVCLAAIISIPLIYLAANKWLNNFAFHIQLNWFIFLMAPLLLMIIAFITVSLQSCRAALTNPVNSLRND